jgi:hypothetical protein
MGKIYSGNRWGKKPDLIHCFLKHCDSTVDPADEVVPEGHDRQEPPLTPLCE